MCLELGSYSMYRCHDNITMRQAHISIHKAHSASHSKTQAQVRSPRENEHNTTGKGAATPPVLERTNSLTFFTRTSEDSSFALKSEMNSF